MWYKKNHAQRTARSSNLKGKGGTPEAGPHATRLSIPTVLCLSEAGLQVRGSRAPPETWPLLPAELHARRQEHHPVRSSSVCSGGEQAARRLQEIQSSHPAMGHAGPRAMQTRNARSALGGLPIGAYHAVLSLHPASENAPTLPTSCFPASGLALPHFFLIFAAKNRSSSVELSAREVHAVIEISAA